jgi:hypothetical protein
LAVSTCCSGIGGTTISGRVIVVVVVVMLLSVVIMMVPPTRGRRLRGSFGYVCLAGSRGTCRVVAGATQISLVILVLCNAAVVIVVVSRASRDRSWCTSKCALCTSSCDCYSGSSGSDNSVVDRHGADLVLLKMGLASLETVGKCRAGEDEGNEGAGEGKLHGG